MSLNQILLIGNVGSDPQMRYTPQGTAVTDFSLAVNNYRRSTDGEREQETEWFRVTAWDRQAESVNQYLTKGQKVFVEGRLSTNQWTQEDGQQRTSLEVRAFRVIFLDRSSDSPGSADGQNNEFESGQTITPSGDKEPIDDVEELPW